jgi:hypothetical protein
MAIVSHSIDFTYPIGPGIRGNSYGQKNLDLQTVLGTKPIRLNSRNTLDESGSMVGLQCKPGLNFAGTTTASVKAAEFSPRFASGTSGADLIGLSVDPILQGSSGAGGDLTGAMRGIEVTMTDGGGGTRTITAASAGLRFRKDLSGKTFTNGLFCVQVAPSEGSTAWTAFAVLPDEGQVAAGTATPDALPANTGYVRVQIGTVLFKLAAYAN